MAQNAANIEQEAAKEEAMLAAMEEELPTDEELEAQLYGDGFVGFEDDDDDYDDDYEDDGYEDDGLDESEEDMTAEAMAESDAASAMADASNPPELDEPYWPRSLPCSLKNPYRTAKSRSRSMSSPIFPNSMAIRKKHLAFPMRMPGRSWQAQRSSLGRSIC